MVHHFPIQITNDRYRDIPHLIPFSDTPGDRNGPSSRFRQLCFAYDPNEVRGPGLRPRNAQVDGVLVAKLQIVLLHEAIHILQGGREEGEKTQKTHQKTITRSFPNSYFTKKLGYSFQAIHHFPIIRSTS